MFALLRRILEIPDVARYASSTAHPGRVLWRMSAHVLLLTGILLYYLVADRYFSEVSLRPRRMGAAVPWSIQQAAQQAFSLMLCIEALLLVLRGSIQSSSTVFTDRTSGLLELQRLAPMDVRLYSLGKIFGVAAHRYVMVLLSLPFAAIYLLLGGVDAEQIGRAYSMLFLCAPFYHMLTLVNGLAGKKLSDVSGGPVALLFLLVFVSHGVSQAYGCRVAAIFNPLLPLPGPWGIGPEVRIDWMGLDWDPLLLAALFYLPATALGIQTRAHQILGHPGAPRPAQVAACTTLLWLVLLLGAAVSAVPLLGGFSPAAHRDSAVQAFACVGAILLCILAHQVSPDGFHWALSLRLARRRTDGLGGLLGPTTVPLASLLGPSAVVFCGTVLLRVLWSRHYEGPGGSSATELAEPLLCGALAVAFPFAYAAATAFTVSHALVYGKRLVAAVFLAVNLLTLIGGGIALGLGAPPQAVYATDLLGPVALFVHAWIPAGSAAGSAVGPGARQAALAAAVLGQAALAAACLWGTRKRRAILLERERKLDVEEGVAQAHA